MSESRTKRRLASRWLAELVFAAVGLVALSATSAARENYAVLVGVNNYTNLDRQYQLQGPVNDVALMRSVLRTRGFAEDNILILADGIGGAQVPTRHGIMQAIAMVTERAKRGDFVYLHFSGHGSQQPEDVTRTDRSHKPDGMNEIFLPRDIGTWTERDTSISNAIVDFEINAVVTALRNRGVFVWAVFDSCHSASMARGAALEDVRFRQVDPLALGVPINRIEKAMRDSAALRAGSREGVYESPLGAPLKLNRDAAGFVAFYAAQTSETAPEMPLPSDASDRKRQGLFSFTLAQAIEQNGSISYRQLRDFVLHRYAALGYLSTTPLIEGTDLDAPIFGDANVKRVQQWAISLVDGQVRLPAGAIQDISDGALFAIVADPVQPDAQAIGYLQAGTVKVFETSLVGTPRRPAAGKGGIALSPDALPKGSYARLLQSSPNFSLTVATPPIATSEGLDESRMRKIIQQLQASPPGGLRVIWVAPDLPADLRLSFGALGAPKSKRDGGRLWLLPPTGELIASGPSRSHSIELAQSDADLSAKLQDRLRRISRYVNLLRVCAQMPVGTSSVADAQVQAVVTRAHGTESVPLPDGVLPKLYADDIVEFKIRNNGPKAADVTLLFLDSQYGITAMYPEAGRLNRIEPGGDDRLKVQINADTVGIERMLVISVAAEPNQPNSDFSFLQQQTLATRRGGPSSPLDALFEEAAFGASSTRGLTRRDDTNAARMRLISWQTALPPDGSKTTRQ
jgi:hypothetical protein